ncbi:MAG: mechanosensitive ion channel [Desulfurococcales archaeon]|nr:mechanosensitive ion channel [Desulfurococcales archaeon]
MDVNELVSLWDLVRGNVLLARTLEAIVLIVIILLFLGVVKRLLSRLGRLSGADQRSLENTYKIIELSTLIITLFLALYLLTQQTLIALFILGIVLVILASSWETIANIASYYAILLSQLATIGEYVVVDGCEGKIRKITVIYTIIDGGYKVCSIPNRVLLSKIKSAIREPVHIKFRIRIWGFEDVEVAEEIMAKLRERLQDVVGSITAVPGEARVYVEEISPDALTASLLVPHPGYRVQSEKIDLVIRELASILKEYGYPFNISLDRSNGGRWREIA